MRMAFWGCIAVVIAVFSWSARYYYQQSIKWQEKALKMTEEIPDQQEYRQAIQKNLEKMKRGEPTWDEQN